mgnify:CR=1 FL=1
MTINKFVDVMDDANLVRNEDVFRFLKCTCCMLWRASLYPNGGARSRSAIYLPDAFVYSMQTVVDEMTTNDHKRATFEEFLEAVRCVTSWLMWVCAVCACVTPVSHRPASMVSLAT